MKTKTFSCTSHWAQCRYEVTTVQVYWNAHLIAKTDNSSHTTYYSTEVSDSIEKIGNCRYASGKYNYTPEQLYHIKAVSAGYLEACKATLLKFIEAHRLQDHHCNDLAVEFDENAKIAKIEERFYAN